MGSAVGALGCVGGVCALPRAGQRHRRARPVRRGLAAVSALAHPVRPAPSAAWPPPRRHRSTSTGRGAPSCASRTVQWRACAWRRTLVTDSRTARARAVLRRRELVGQSCSRRSTPAAPARRALASLAAQSAAAVSGHCCAHLGEGVARDAFDVVHLGRGPGRVAIEAAGGQLGLQHDDRQRVAEQVVQVARDAFPLGWSRGVRSPRRPGAAAASPWPAPRRRCSPRRPAARGPPPQTHW